MVKRAIERAAMAMLDMWFDLEGDLQREARRTPNDPEETDLYLISAEQEYA